MLPVWEQTRRFSALQRAEIAEIADRRRTARQPRHVSVLFNEPKLLKSRIDAVQNSELESFSALQRAEIAEMLSRLVLPARRMCFSALQRAEIAEMYDADRVRVSLERFSALQRAEIAEI